MGESIVDRIRALCLRQKTSITKLEAELGYANGTIGKWAKAKRKPPLEKVMSIAELLHTTPDYLYNGESPATQTGDGALDEELIARLLLLTPEERKQVDAFVQGLLASRSA